ncbi:MAG: hypothetical protein EXX96DRAFT_621070 [Benjaminiella poitrasii]|nr:MAG: hypothetical protein EXX96DRAFT_621070 [Benjaminiella poitrasii]
MTQNAAVKLKPKRNRKLPRREVLDTDFMTPANARILDDLLLIRTPSQHDRVILSELWGQDQNQPHLNAPLPHISIKKHEDNHKPNKPLTTLPLNSSNKHPKSQYYKEMLKQRKHIHDDLIMDLSEVAIIPPPPPSTATDAPKDTKKKPTHRPKVVVYIEKYKENSDDHPTTLPLAGKPANFVLDVKGLDEIKPFHVEHENEENTDLNRQTAIHDEDHNRNENKVGNMLATDITATVVAEKGIHEEETMESPLNYHSTKEPETINKETLVENTDSLRIDDNENRNQSTEAVLESKDAQQNDTEMTELDNDQTNLQVEYSKSLADNEKSDGQETVTAIQVVEENGHDKEKVQYTAENNKNEEVEGAKEEMQVVEIAKEKTEGEGIEVVTEVKEEAQAVGNEAEEGTKEEEKVKADANADADEEEEEAEEKKQAQVEADTKNIDFLMEDIIQPENDLNDPKIIDVQSSCLDEEIITFDMDNGKDAETTAVVNSPNILHDDNNDINKMSDHIAPLLAAKDEEKSAATDESTVMQVKSEQLSHYDTDDEELLSEILQSSTLSEHIDDDNTDLSVFETDDDFHFLSQESSPIVQREEESTIQDELQVPLSSVATENSTHSSHDTPFFITRNEATMQHDTTSVTTCNKALLSLPSNYSAPLSQASTIISPTVTTEKEEKKQEQEQEQEEEEYEDDKFWTLLREKEEEEEEKNKNYEEIFQLMSSVPATTTATVATTATAGATLLSLTSSGTSKKRKRHRILDTLKEVHALDWVVNGKDNDIRKTDIGKMRKRQLQYKLEQPYIIKKRIKSCWIIE